MTLRHLRIFVTVAQCGSMTRAAEILHTAQPAVSFAVAEIEKYYQITLFERIHRRLSITEAGKELLIKAEEVLASFGEFEALAIRSDGLAAVRIGASLTLGKTYLPDFLKKIREAFPEAKISVKIDKTAEIENEIADGRLDLAVVEGKITSPVLSTHPFAEDRLVAVAGVDYPVADRLELSTLTEHPLLLRERGSASRDLFDSAMATLSLSVSPTIESVSNEALFAAAEKDLGIAILPEGLVPPHLAAGKLRQITLVGPGLERQSFLITHRSKKLSPLQKEIYSLFLKDSPQNSFAP